MKIKEYPGDSKISYIKITDYFYNPEKHKVNIEFVYYIYD